MGSTAHFTIEYDGDALQNHDMDVRDLAPALIALTDLFDEANRVINGESTKAVVKIKAPFKAGSFGVDLILLHDWIGSLTEMFSGKGATASANLLAFVIALIGLIKWMRGRKISAVRKKENKESVLTTIDGDTYIINTQVLNLFQNLSIRNSLEKTVKTPLDSEGITKFRIIDEINQQEQIVDRNEREYFVVPTIPDELIEEKEYVQTVQIVSISFEKGYKWRFSDGQSLFTADIADDKFIERVSASKETFKKDDYMKIHIRTKQHNTSQGLKSETQVIKVIEHRAGPQQIELPYQNGVDENE